VNSGATCFVLRGKERKREKREKSEKKT
jgi:hypothetical protein